LLELKPSDRGGRGVFAKELIKKGTVFLCDPIIFIKRSELANYVFEEKGKHFIALGYGSLINHSSNDNCYWVADIKKRTCSYIAMKNIKTGQELLQNYNWPEYPKDFLD